MNPPDDPTPIDDQVRAMLHRRAADIPPEAAATLPDATAPSVGDQPIRTLPGRWRLAALAACILVVVGIVALSVGDGAGDSVKADRTTPTVAPTDSRPNPDSTSDDAGIADPTRPSDPAPTTRPGAEDDGASTPGPSSGPAAGDPGGRPDPTPPPQPTTPTPPPPPVITVSQAQVAMPTRFYTRSCNGALKPHGEGQGLVRIDRSGPADQAVTVTLTATGSLGGSVTGLPPTVTIPAGQDMVLASFKVAGTTAGQVSIVAGPGEGYRLGQPASRTYDLGAAETVIDCLRPVPVSPATQTIAVGQRPQDLVFSPVHPDLTDPHPVGALPPGLGRGPSSVAPTRTTDTAGWTGAATTPGTYQITYRHCLSPAMEEAGPCDGTSTVTIVVREP